jgi:dTDP-4-dehydrorhamnose reductase
MRLLITGVSGFLGAALAEAAQATPEWDTTGTYFSHAPPTASCALFQLDLRDAQAVQAAFAAIQPDSIIHTACSNRDDDNVSAIVPAAENLALACRTYSARLVHVSTDLVFDGEQAPYYDEAAAHALTPYGAAKAQAEAVILRAHPTAAIGRPSLIWSLDPLDRQTTWLVEGLRRGTVVTLFTDEIRCPVHLSDLTAALLELAARPEVSGSLNLAGRQPLSRWDFGMRLLRALGLEPADNLRPGAIAASGLVRARNLQLLCRRAERLLATRLRGVDEILGLHSLPSAGMPPRSP